VDFIRAKGAITLFGDGFGEIFKPTKSDSNAANAPTGSLTASHPVYPRWARLPPEKDYLAVSTQLIQDIMEKRADENQQLWKVVDGIYWHKPGKAFEQCDCSTAGKPCDQVQLLLPKLFRLRSRGFRNPGQLPENGAVIFGHSTTLPVLWGDEADEVPVKDHRGVLWIWRKLRSNGLARVKLG
jgi:hypothetical protein